MLEVPLACVPHHRPQCWSYPVGTGLDPARPGKCEYLPTTGALVQGLCKKKLLNIEYFQLKAHKCTWNIHKAKDSWMHCRILHNHLHKKETLNTTILPPSRFLDPPTIFNDLSLIIQHPLHFTAPYIGQSHLGYEWLPEVILVLDRDCWSQCDQEGHIMFPQVYKISNHVSKASLWLRFLL